MNTLTRRAYVEALDIVLRDIRNSNKVMDGITLMFSDDFRLTFPVIVKGTRADFIIIA